MTANALTRVYPEMGAGGFTRYDGSLEFYGRINALLRPDMTVLDLGAGRGRQFETANPYTRSLNTLQGKVARLVGVDVDDAVLENPSLDEAHVYDGTRLPFEDAQFDLVLSDWVLEHIADPEVLPAEVFRVLRPGGWFCARTPNSMSYIAVASRMVPNRFHAKVLSVVQKGRRHSEDVFPTLYRLNTLGHVRKWFPTDKRNNCTYTYSPEPAYHFGKSAMVRVMAAAQYVKKPLARENLFAFVQKL